MGVDIAVATELLTNRLPVFTIKASSCRRRGQLCYRRAQGPSAQPEKELPLPILERQDANITGNVVSTDHLARNSEYPVFDREGGKKELFVFRGGADATDGIGNDGFAAGCSISRRHLRRHEIRPQELPFLRRPRHRTARG